MSRIEQDRKKLGYGLPPFNQKLTTDIEQTRRRQNGDTGSKGYKAEQRKLRHEEFMKNLPRIQLERALRHMFDETVTPEDVGYIFRHVDELGLTAIVGVEPK